MLELDFLTFNLFELNFFTIFFRMFLAVFVGGIIGAIQAQSHYDNKTYIYNYYDFTCILVRYIVQSFS